MNVTKHLPQTSRTSAPVALIGDAYATATDEALAVVAAGRALDAERARLAALAEAERTVALSWPTMSLAERVAVVLDARLGHLIADDGLFAAVCDDVAAVLVERA